jgi:2-polyprenyl-3-methyl-5-hydroxy-6-metoxy-1,4-benzoquinol methylase
MPDDAQPKPDSAAFAEEFARIERFYTGTFLAENAWTTLKPRAYLYLRQRQRRLREALLEHGLDTPEKLRELSVLDVGSGGGTNLAWLVELGADPAHLTGVDLVAQRVETARQRLPAVRWLTGDITQTDVGGPFDLVLLVAVLTSVTSAALKRRIVERCLSLLKPGGVLFFYDLMTLREDAGTRDYKKLTYEEVAGYLGGRSARWHKRDYLRPDLAEKLTTRYGVTAAELVQATGLFNIEASFAHLRV